MISNFSKLEAFIEKAACIFLLPITIFYFFGIVVGLRSNLALYRVNHYISANVICDFSVLLLFGYSLYSLWWLLFHFKAISYKEIPIVIKVGLFTGSLISLLLFIPSCIFVGIDSRFSFKLMAFGALLTMLPLAVIFSLLFCVFNHGRRL